MKVSGLTEAHSTAYDLVIIGGGLVGASFALTLAALQRQASMPLKILVIESAAVDVETGESEDFDARTTALSHGSQQLFQALGLWEEFAEPAISIEKIHVSDRGHFGASRLSAADMQVEALGYVLENRVLGKVLNRALLEAEGIDLLSPASVTALKPCQQGMRLSLTSTLPVPETIQAGLVVLADGGRSGLTSGLGIASKVHNYQQSAVIANVAFDRPHDNIAYERFTGSGPVAVLPLADQQLPRGNVHRGALIWTVPAAETAEITALDDAQFLQRLQHHFGHRLGSFVHAGQRAAFPLKLTVAKEQARPGLVLLGNVAHALHPVAGQGLNLALRDAVVLAEKLVQASRNKVSPGTMSLLQAYVEARSTDQSNTILMSDKLISLFSNDDVGISLLRKTGLLAIDMIPSVRKAFTRNAMGLMPAKV